MTRKSLLSKTVCLLSVGLLLASIVASCTGPNKTSKPALPDGFLNAPLPSGVDLNGYLYLDQGSPLVIPADFTHGSSINVTSASLWGGPDTGSVGGAVVFKSQSDAQSAANLANSVGAQLWSTTNGNTLYAARSGPGAWTIALENSISQKQMTTLSAKYPGIRTDFSYFPGTSPLKPLAAGFVNVDSSLVTALGSQIGISLLNYTSALQTAKVSRISFVVYTQHPVQVASGNLNANYLDSLQAGVIGVGRSGYPSVAFSVFFDQSMQNAGFTKYNVSGVDVYQYDVNGMTVLVARNGNVVYGTAAHSKDVAAKLMLSVFSQ